MKIRTKHRLVLLTGFIAGFILVVMTVERTPYFLIPLFRERPRVAS
jgi:hypothetical protein